MNIVISRPKQFADLIRDYKILVDGQEVAVIGAGKKIQLQLPENASTLVAKIDWCGSNEISVSELVHDVELEVKNSFAHLIWFPFVPMYYIVFARHKYLQLKPCA